MTQSTNLNYQKITGYKSGLLVNFGLHPKTEILRMANTDFSRLSRLSRLNNQVEDLRNDKDEI